MKCEVWSVKCSGWHSFFGGHLAFLSQNFTIHGKRAKRGRRRYYLRSSVAPIFSTTRLVNAVPVEVWRKHVCQNFLNLRELSVMRRVTHFFLIRLGHDGVSLLAEKKMKLKNESHFITGVRVGTTSTPAPYLLVFTEHNTHSTHSTQAFPLRCFHLYSKSSTQDLE